MDNIDALTTILSKTTVNEENGISFAGRGLKLDTEDDAKQITDAIDKCTEMTYMDMDGNTIGVEAAKAISQSLRKHPEFKKAIWKNMFTGRTKEEIPDALNYLGNGLIAANASLTEIDLSDNAFGPIGVQGLSTLLKSKCFFNLKVLKLNNNGLGIGGGQMLAKGLLDCYNDSGRKFSLRVFVAGRNRLENKGAKALSKVFKELGTLEEISMPQNGIYLEGIKALSESFSKNPKLRIINMNDNTLGEEGSKYLAKALSTLPNLETLNVGDCLVKTDGALVIAKALKEISNIKSLIMDNNEITLAGGKALIKALKDKQHLEEVILDGNMFGELGIEEMQNMFNGYKYEEAMLSLNDDELGDSDEDRDEEDDDDSRGGENTDEESDVEVENASIDIGDSYNRSIVEEFISNPTEERLRKLRPHPEEHLKKYIQEHSSSVDMIKVSVQVILAISSFCESDNKEIKKIATEATIQIYRYFFTLVNKDQLGEVFNWLPVQLRLLKCEDKKVLLDNCNIQSCIYGFECALKENVIQDDWKSLYQNLLETRKKFAK